MIVNIQDDILKLHSLGLLNKLLTDKTTGQLIIWATDAYTGLGPRYGRSEQISSELITGLNSSVIKTRARKELEQQSSRTRQHGEVSTPLWVCKKMCDYTDEMWDEKFGWQKYVDARVLEITCGEAPFLVSRYDVETGEAIPIPDRIGLLDRKLRAVNENAQSEDDWLKWTFRAFHGTYGYEFQGDNLLIARVNLLMTFEEYLWERWKRKPTISEYGKLITVIIWNVWQMDGLQGTIPYGTAEEEFRQFNLFDFLDGMSEPDEKNKQPRCLVYNWLGGGSVEYSALPIKGKRAMKFDFVIGNPPYQDETVGEQKSFAPPVYHLFMDEAYKVADKVELIHPARFLFDAGSTPKAWNQKMLHDKHLKVTFYKALSSEVFPNTDIKGGVAVTYRDTSEIFGAINHFVVFDELRAILKKAGATAGKGLDTICYPAEIYRFSDVMHKENPEIEAMLSKGHKYDFKTSVLGRLNNIIFFSDKPNDGAEYVQIMGLIKGERATKWIKRSYVKEPNNFNSYKIFVPKANGSGALGEVLSTPVIGQPVIGHTQTFISIGNFKSEYAANACIKYIKSKFARTLLGVLKITQDNPPEKWRFVPLQDFGPASDIDWNQSIPEIDQQLYKKYRLDEKEIQFIETHVKEMT